jgi:hypothetical protein
MFHGMHRVLAILCLSALLAVTPGCFVINELNEGQKLMDQHMNNGNNKKKADGAQVANTEEARSKALKRASKYWDKVRSIAPGSVSEGIVGCRVKGSTQFMTEEACLARGGSPGSAGG